MKALILDSEITFIVLNLAGGPLDAIDTIKWLAGREFDFGYIVCKIVSLDVLSWTLNFLMVKISAIKPVDNIVQTWRWLWFWILLVENIFIPAIQLAHLYLSASSSAQHQMQPKMKEMSMLNCKEFFFFQIKNECIPSSDASQLGEYRSMLPLHEDRDRSDG